MITLWRWRLAVISLWKRAEMRQVCFRPNIGVILLGVSAIVVLGVSVLGIGIFVQEIQKS